jgi:hypothetical protein
MTKEKGKKHILVSMNNNLISSGTEISLFKIEKVVKTQMKNYTSKRKKNTKLKKLVLKMMIYISNKILTLLLKNLKRRDVKPNKK